MEVNIRGRNVSVPERFEDYVGSKSEKIAGLMPKTQAFEVRLSRLSDRNPQLGDKVELTMIGPGPVIRAESSGPDKYAAFDIAYGRLLERVRRLKDKRKPHKAGRGRTSLAEASATDFGTVDVQPASLETIEAIAAGENPNNGVEHEEPPYSPVVIRKKEFPTEKLSVEEAVDQMELVGHDFFLFVEHESGRPSVVYRRKGWNYGVISLADA